MSRTGRFLFALGVAVMVFEVIGVLINMIHAKAIHQFALNGSAWIGLLFGAFFQGGTLIGLGKIIELLQQTR